MRNKTIIFTSVFLLTIISVIYFGWFKHSSTVQTLSENVLENNIIDIDILDDNLQKELNEQTKISLNSNEQKLSGRDLLKATAEQLNFPSTFYLNTSIEYLLYEPAVTEEIEEALKDYLNSYSFANEVIVLTYHHLLKNEDNKNFINNSAVISIEDFENQIEFLYDSGYNTYPLHVLENFINREINLPDKTVFITFDDGYLSNYFYAYPILKKYNYHATIFAISSMIREEPELFDPDGLNFISWNEIDNYKDVFSIDSHTHDFHRKKDGESYLISKSEEEVLNDLVTSRNMLNSVYFAYPYGEYNQETITLLKEAGFQLAFTTKPGTVQPTSNRYELNRYGIYPQTTFTDFKAIFE